MGPVQAPAPKPDPVLQQTWVTISTNGSPGKGWLRFRPDGRFKSTFRTEKGKLDSIEGTYRIERSPKGVDKDLPFLVVLLLDREGARKLGASKSALATGRFPVEYERYFYNPAVPVVTALAITYAPVGQEARVLKAVEDK
ncbi:hypothetical protein EON79_07595 [bacterium]|nr:MAG: hypothetical protein EON79_07595 [bacterium]